MPSARSAQRTPSRKIMTPRSANNVHRAARHLQVPPPTAAAFATSGCCTSRIARGLFVQLDILFIATCSHISFQLWPCYHFAWSANQKLESLSCTFCIFLQDHLSWERRPAYPHTFSLLQPATNYNVSLCGMIGMDLFLDVS